MMELSNDLISKFVKVTSTDKNTKNEITLYGTVVLRDGVKMVCLDGSDDTDLLVINQTTDVEPNDRVTVMIKNHQAVVTGNLSSPAVRTQDERIQTIFDVGDRINNLEADNLKVNETLVAHEAVIDKLNVTYAKIGDLEATNLVVSEHLKANEAEFKELNAKIAGIDTLIFGSASGNVIQTEFANSVIAQVGDAQIKSAMIESIITDNVSIMSQDGHLLIDGDTIQINDATKCRVQIGKDASGDYSILIYNEAGELIFDKGGITENSVPDGLIRDDMVNANAKISGAKIFISDENKTLDVAFKSLSSEVKGVNEQITSQGTQISAIVGQIETKVWQQDIDTAKNEMSTQYSTLSQTVNGISTTVANHAAELDGMAIGGRNLVRDSKLDRDTDMWEFSTKQCSASFDNGYLEITRTYDANYTSRSFNTQYSTQNPLLIPDNMSGETYVLQAEFKILEGHGVSPTSSLFWRVYYDDSTSYEEANLIFPTDLTEGEWRRCYVVKTFGTRNWTSGQLSIAMANSNHGICIRNIMLEKATKPSNWVPAAEDLDVRLSSAETKITQNESSITGLATRTTTNETAIASLELTADGLTAKVDAAKKQRYHQASGTTGVTGYVAVCKFIVNGGYQNRPITFQLNNRGQQASFVSWCFNSVAGSDPGLSHLQCDGGINVWAYKSDTSTWYLIVQKSEGYDTIYVNDFANNNANVSVTWTNVHHDALPTENITAHTRLAGKLTKAVVDNAAKTATNYLNFSTAGLVVGDMTASTLGNNVLIDSDSVDIRNGTTTLASFGANYLYLSKNSRNATIDLCNGLAKLYHQSKYSYDTLFVIDTTNATEIMGSLTPLCVTSTKTSGHVTIQFANANGVIGEIGMYDTGTNQWITRNVPSTASTYSVLDTGNFDAIMDSGWINCLLNTGTFTRYSNDLPQPQVRKIGKQVYLRGEAKPVTSVTPATDSDTVIATIPSGYRPSERQQFIMQGSGSYRWMMSIHTDGRIAISRYSNSTTANMQVASGAWLCCHAQWLID